MVDRRCAVSANPPYSEERAAEWVGPSSIDLRVRICTPTAIAVIAPDTTAAAATIKKSVERPAPKRATAIQPSPAAIKSLTVPERNLFLEMPPGHTLSDLAEENLPGIKSVPVEASVLPRALRLAHQEEASNIRGRSQLLNAEEGS
jgi:hypothetical protein